MKFKNKELDFSNNTIYIMGILNVTPDSFSDGGKYNNRDRALFHVEEMIKNGADIIDVGGESTRPFSEPVSEGEEIDRVIPIIEKINNNFKTIISIDTYKSKVAKEACKNGAEIINDISGFTFDSKMIDIAKEYDTACVVMHIKGTPKNMQSDPQYDNVIREIYSFLDDRVDALRREGLSKIIIDVGFGFGKSLDDNYILLDHLDEFKKMYCPIMAGISRKSMIGKIAESKPEERISGTIALNTLAVMKGARIIRVHDVKESRQMAKVLEKYLTVQGE